MNQFDKAIESAILGALMVEPFAPSIVFPIIREEYFYDQAHKFVYRAALRLFEAGTSIDTISVVHELKKAGRLEEIGGAYFVETLTNKIATSANIEIFCRKVHEYYILRELVILGASIQSKSQIPSTDCFDVIASVNKRITELTTFISSKTKTVGQVFDELMGEIQEVIDHGIRPGLHCGLPNIDRITGGWQKGQLIVVAARPGMGKTAFALKCGTYPSVELNKPVLMFSLEMTAIELVGRIASSEAHFNSSKIGSKSLNQLEKDSVQAGCVKLKNAPFFIDDTPGLSMMDMKIRAKKMKHEHGIELIIVDYLQLMAGEIKGNREQEISYITRNLKGLAKELGLPIIALSQLSRKVEERTDKRPQLSDLRESGAIEQDADIVSFLFRPAYYFPEEQFYTYGTRDLETPNLMLFDIAKGRGLKIQEVPVKFFGETMTVTNYNLGDQYEQAEQNKSSLTNNTDFL
jgi:replicative DNA helicase